MARVPLYKAAETEMIRRIRSGEWEVGLRLPNEFGLADEFGVSQGTMRRALMTLEGMGLLTRKPGRGTIVADPVAANSNPGNGAVAGFDRLVDADGEAPEFEVFRARAQTRGTNSAEAGLFETERVSALERTLKIGDTRAALDEITVPEAVLPALPEDGDADFPTLLGEIGLSVHAIEDEMGSAVTSMSESVALSVDRHTALLVVTRVAKDSSGSAIARQVLRIADEGIAYKVSLTG